MLWTVNNNNIIFIVISMEKFQWTLNTALEMRYVTIVTWIPDKWLGPWGKIVHDAVGLDHSKLLCLRLSTDYWL